MKTQIFLLFILVGLMVSCKNSNEFSPTKALHEEIMVIHDEVMPKTSDIRKMVKKLRADKEIITKNNESLLKTFDHMINELESADELMMKWMSQYKKPKFSDTSEETIDALNYQMDRIKYVKEKMETALVRSANFGDRINSVQKSK